MNATPLVRLAARYGIASEYYDAGGTLHRVPEESLRRLLAAMGAPAGDDDALERAIERMTDAAWRRHVPATVSARAGDRTVQLTITVQEAFAAETLGWQLREESGGEHAGTVDASALHPEARREIDGEQWVQITAAIPVPGESGYHRFRLLRTAAAPPAAEALLIVAPRQCHRPPELAAGRRLWGLTAQLYSLRSQRNWGIGDFTDLVRLIEFGAEHGAAFVGLNPLHSPLAWDDAHASPYDPSSRRFLNALLLDVEAIPEFAASAPARARVADADFQAVLRSLRAAEQVDYAAVAGAKIEILEHLWEAFRRDHLARGSARAREFVAFAEERGEALRRYAEFQVLHEHLRERDPGAWGWPAWPEEYRDRAAPAVARLLAGREERVQFFMYLQWNAAAQLRGAAGRAQQLGMAVGLYADLALSSRKGGADTWIDRDLYIDDAGLGAPPDPFNQAGQNWGLPPWHPLRLREAGYRPFIETLRANMRAGGALRIDHVMSLMRCFLIPAGADPAAGTYLSYPFEDLRAILALESERNRCLVIGEDLGTVPGELRQELARSGVLGYRVLYFEKAADGSIKAPTRFDVDVLSVISTHDLPTLTGFWQGADIEWRGAHDLYPDRDAREQQIVSRAEDRARLMVALEKEGLAPGEADAEVPSGSEMTPALRAAFHRYLARGASLLVGVQVEDLLGEREQANLPGTTFEHPNWRRRLALQIEDWPADEGARAVLAAVREERPPAPGEAPPAAPAAVPARRAVIPRATYRVQLHKDFRFRDLERLLPYLEALGISHVYCSPYFKARAGSVHGYDVIDHNAINPEIGDREELDRLCAALARHRMGQVLDMVPNHMAVSGGGHRWWLDVLENGPASRYAEFFDIDWHPIKDELRGKVLLPVLGDHYGNVLDEGELRLDYDEAEGRFAVAYHEHRFPVDPREYPRILQPGLERLRSRLPENDPSLIIFESLVTAFANLPPRSAVDEDSRRERARDRKLHGHRLAIMAREAPDIRRFIDECLREFNGDESYPADTLRMHQLLEAQAYRLAYWRVASHEINYRRFFDINDLASLRMEKPEVFEATHGLVLALLAEGKLDGLRIDHPDGLYDPAAYFKAVQERAGASPLSDGDELPLYLLAEKILAGGESLRPDWAIHGTTGYDFANLVSRLLVHPAGLKDLDKVYEDFIGRALRYEDVLHRSKTLIMQTSLASELNVLAAELDRIAEQDPHTRDFGLGGLRNALLETIACYPVYRTYTVDGEVADADAAVINEAVEAAKRRSEASDTSVFDFLRDVLLNVSAAGRGETLQQRVARFGMRLQQYTSPVAAKGMEDTAFYRYCRLVSLNEVGGTPELPGASVREFHAANAERLRHWPHAMLASSTHDTKRSEDVRARLHALSEMPSEWAEHAARWTRANADLELPGGGRKCVDRDAEYLLYQTLLGVWPFAGVDGPGARERLAARLEDYIIKAAKEAKRRTSWLNPDREYEESLQAFVRALLAPSQAFLEDFLPFQRKIARVGLMNGLTQLLLKFTCPGVPDLYQGNELWRLDLVDPDNRRPVDFDRRRALLEDFVRRGGDGAALLRELLADPADGRLKLYVTWRALDVRRRYAAVFERGGYRPLQAGGRHADHVVAFVRERDGIRVVAAALRWTASLLDDERGLIDDTRLEETTVELPSAAGTYLDVLSGEQRAMDAPVASVPAARLFGPLPIALWLSAAEAPPRRGAAEADRADAL